LTYFFLFRHPGEPGSQPFPHFIPEPEATALPPLPTGGRDATTRQPNVSARGAKTREREPTTGNARNDKTVTNGNTFRQAHILVIKGQGSPDRIVDKYQSRLQKFLRIEVFEIFKHFNCAMRNIHNFDE